MSTPAPDHDPLRVVLATTNPDKIREIQALLRSLPVEWRGLGDFPPVPMPEETGTTFAQNAAIKATGYAAALAASLSPGSLIVAEDSGLVVDALDGAPGVHSARYLAPDASYSERFAAIAHGLAEHPERPRTARFVCAVAAADVAGRLLFETTGIVEGEVAATPAGDGGFGYDPIFYHPPSGATLAEVADARKREVSHRGQAFRAFGAWLAEYARRPRG